MNINLLSLNLLLILCFILTALAAFLLLRRLSTRKKKQRWGRKQVLICLGIGFLASTLIESFFLIVYSGQKLPLFVVDFAPLTISATFAVMTFKNNQLLYRVLAGVLVVMSGLFSLLLVNSYFQYYPTLYAALNINNYQHISASQEDSVTFHYDPKLDTINNQNIIENNSDEQQANLPSSGQVYSFQIPGKLSGFKARTTYVYVPPIAFSPLKLNIPVIVLLPGTPGSPSDWLDGGKALSTLNNFAARHNGVAPIVVMTDENGSITNDTECTDGSRGNAEGYLTQDVPNYIKSHFDVSNNSANWAIGGLSDGGLCGIMLTLLHPDVYHYFLDFGGEIGPEDGNKDYTISTLFNGSETAWQIHQPAYLLQTRKYTDVGGFFTVGKADSFVVQDAVKQLYNESTQDKLNVVYENIVGQHTFATWAQSFQDSLPWISNQLGATACYNSCY